MSLYVKYITMLIFCQKIVYLVLLLQSALNGAVEVMRVQ